MRSLRIGIVSHEYPPAGAGGATMCRALARRLAGRGHDLEVFTEACDRNPGESDDAGVRVRRLSCGARTLHRGRAMVHARFVPMVATAVRRRHEEHAFDLLHAHFAVPGGLAAMVAARKLGIGYVLTVHGSDVPGHNPLGYDRVLGLLGPVWRRVVGSAARVVSPSEHLFRLLEARSGPRLRAEVINNGVGAAHGEVPRSGRARRVLFVGRLIRIKGARVVVEAADRLPPGWSVDVVGEGPELNRLRRLGRECPREVRFHGRIDHDDPRLAELYRSATIFAFPAFAENFSMVLLEAMACGCAVLAADAGGNREVVGDAGRLVSPHDGGAFAAALRALAEKPRECERLAAAARRRVNERFSLTGMAERYERLFAEVTDETPERR